MSPPSEIANTGQAPPGGSVWAVLLEHLQFRYAKGPVVLDIPRFALAKGERVFLHGPSGSGKTTLLGVLAGILPARSGLVHVLGQNYGQLKSRALDAFRGANLGYIFQMFNLIPYLNVLQNIVLPLDLSPARRARLGGESQAEAASALAERLGIASLLKEPVTQLSVGQQQRVAAARALIGSPPLIIADEPTSALDSEHREAFLHLLFAEAERAEAAILFVSHDHGLMPLFSRVVSLRDMNRAALRS